MLTLSRHLTDGEKRKKEDTITVYKNVEAFF